MNPQVFREYDIRGDADRDLTGSFVHDLGRAIAAALRARRDAESAEPFEVIVGRDCRLTSPRIFDALADGITEGGADVVDIGVVPTPVLYFASHHLPAAGAVVITGSHNPPGDNGFKILAGKEALFGDAIGALGDRIASGDIRSLPAHERGQVRPADVLPAYLDHAEAALDLGPRRPRVVVDAGNGAGGPAALSLYRRLGFDVVPLFCEMDGRFPNHHPDPTEVENLADLREAVAREGAELGLALDGDADRLGVIDGGGRVLWGDQLMILFGRDILARRPGAAFVAEVKCSQALYDELERAGGRPIMWKVGHSLIKAKIRDEGAALGGEMSGHLFFNDRYPGFDDALYAGARLLELLSREARSLAELASTLPETFATPEMRIDCDDERKFEVVRRAGERLRARHDALSVVAIDGVRVRFTGGWGLVRASNTQPALVVRCEADDEARLEAIAEGVQSAVEDAVTELSS